MAEQCVKPWVWTLTLKEKKNEHMSFKPLTSRRFGETCQLQTDPSKTAARYWQWDIWLELRNYLYNSLFQVQNTKPLPLETKCIVFTAWTPGASHRCRVSTFRSNSADIPFTTSEDLHFNNLVLENILHKKESIYRHCSVITRALQPGFGDNHTFLENIPGLNGNVAFCTLCLPRHLDGFCMHTPIWHKSFHVTHLGLFYVGATCPGPRIHQDEAKIWPKEALK